MNYGTMITANNDEWIILGPARCKVQEGGARCKKR